LKKNVQGNLQIIKVGKITGQIITKDSLDINKNYIFRVTTNQSFDAYFHIAIGIMEKSKAFEQQLRQYDLCFLTSQPNKGLDIIEKGQNLCDEGKRLQGIEVRINISKRILKFCSYPNYYHINSCKAEKIQDIDYNFCIQISCIKGNFILGVETISDVSDDSFQTFN
ncbi:von willebrand factor type A domain protein, partial (macronuclear) [Tetrahymena thermophila SB210]